ncbi:MAG: hypothetical protein JRH11_25605, partial [Deltaproteobacteria bacterium]|nr:hypothetical protein [Deltaproteobacteria bacterium]
MTAIIVVTGTLAALPRCIQAQERASGDWVLPRTAVGRPDLQGNWSNATLTPIGRPEGQELFLTPEQVDDIEGRRQDRIETSAQPSDPDRVAPPVGGDGSTGAAGGVGGYNYFFIDAGDRVAVYDGQPRSSLITDPPNGRRPDFTEEGQRRRREAREFGRQFGEYDNPENRPLAERCLMSFGSNAGPPMLPNYFYNNNYTIVQTPDHIMIMTEMVHDVRVIRMGRPNRLPEQMRPWMGDSWGHWEGDTLVVVTTNIHPDQPMFAISTAVFLPSEGMRVTERFTRVSATAINYEFLVEDPIMLTAPVAG